MFQVKKLAISGCLLIILLPGSIFATNSINFYWAQWCAPCKQMKSSIDQVKSACNMPDLQVNYHDVGDSDSKDVKLPAEAKNSIPTTVFNINNKKTTKLGAMSLAAIKKLVCP